MSRKKASPKQTQATLGQSEVERLHDVGSLTWIDPILLTLAARGGEQELHSAFRIFAQMSEEEIRLMRRAIYRLETWADSYLVGNGR
jgi:hypothetical protein